MKDMRFRLAVGTLALLCSVGCATPARPPATATVTPEPVSLQAFSRSPFLTFSLPSSRMHRHEEAVKVLGNPIEIVRKDAPSQHDPTVINSVITLRYAFCELLYLRVSGKNVENLIPVRLHGNQVPLRYGIRFGRTTREQIVKLFGTPPESEENSFSYNVAYTQEITSATTFFFRGDKLLQVDISSLMMD